MWCVWWCHKNAVVAGKIGGGGGGWWIEKKKETFLSLSLCRERETQRVHAASHKT
jgi:hypothetical protein